jgi:twitching motility two-component system response regulator PilH
MDKKTVLVIDDSVTDYLYVKKVLSKYAYSVIHAESAQQGIELAKQVLPDCILMDVVMPKMNGFQATRILSRDELTSDIPIVVLSSKSQRTDQVWAKRQGAQYYVTKPADPSKLLAVLKSILD